MPTSLKRYAIGFSIASVCLMLSAGCASEQPTAYTPDEKAKFSAPLGQPMPPEAKAAMEKMGQPGPGAPPPAPKAPAPQ